MNRRLQQFLAAENISQSQFADIIGVARASVSHILAGRNKPGFDFIESMARHYPALNLDWLITGKGRMYASDSAPKTVSKEERQVSETGLFDDEYIASPQIMKSQEEITPTATVENKETIPLSESAATPFTPHTTQRKQHNIVRIVVFYDDNTYQELK